MSDTNAAAPQAGADQQPQEGTPQSQADNAEQPQIDPAVLQRELQEARREAAKYRTEKQKLEAWKTEREQAEMTETERQKQQLTEYEKRVADMQAELRETRLRGLVETTAARLGFANPSLAPKLIADAAVEYDDAGKPTNVERLLTDLLASEPYLAPTKKAGTADGGARVATETNVQPGFDRMLHAYQNTESS